MSEWPAGIEVPDLVGMAAREARAVCRELGLFLGYYNLDQQLPQSFEVAYQDPAPGSVAARLAVVRIWTTLDPSPEEPGPR